MAMLPDLSRSIGMPSLPRVSRQLGTVKPVRPRLVPDPFDLYIRRMEYRQEIDERSTMYNILDPWLNTEARRRLSAGTWYEDIPFIGDIANTIHGYIDIASRLYDIRDPATMFMTTLRFFGDTFDLTSSLTVKPWLYSAQYGTTLGEAYRQLTGFGTSTGRHYYWFGDYNETIDWLPDNWAVNIIGEMLIDPSIVLTFGVGLAPSVAGAGTRAGKRAAAQQVGRVADNATTSYASKFSRTHISLFADPVKHHRNMVRANRHLWRADKAAYKKTMLGYRQAGMLQDGITDGVIDAMYHAGVKELGAKRFYRALAAYDRFERRIMKLLRKASPIRMTKRTMQGIWRRFKYKQVTEQVSDIERVLKNYEALESYEDAEKIDLPEMERAYADTLKNLRYAQKVEDDEMAKRLYDNLVEIQEKIARKHQYNEHKTMEKFREFTQRNLKQNEIEIERHKRQIERIKTELKQDSPEYKKLQRQIEHHQAQIDLNEAMIESATADLENNKKLFQRLKKIASRVDEKGVHGGIKDVPRTEEAFRKQKEQLGKLKAISKEKMTEDQFARKRELEETTGLYKDVQGILDFSLQSHDAADYLASITSSKKYRGVRRVILELSRDQYEEYARVAQEHKKTMDEAVKRFSGQRMDLPTLLAQARKGEAEFKKTMDEAVKDELIDDYIQKVNQLRYRDRLARLDKEIDTLLDTESSELATMLSERYSFEDKADERGFLGRFTDSLAEDILKGMREVKRDADADVLDEYLVQVNETIDNMTEVFRRSPKLGQLYKSLHTLNKTMLEASPTHFKNMALMFGSDQNKMFQIAEANKTTVHGQLDGLLGAIENWKEDPAYEELLRYARGDKTAPVKNPTMLQKVGAMMYRDLKEPFGNKDYLIDRVYMKKYIEHIQKGHLMAREHTKFDYLFDLFDNTVMERKSRGHAEAIIKPHLKHRMPKSQQELFLKTYNDMRKMRNMLSDIDETYRPYRKDTTNIRLDAFDEDIRKILHSERISELDTSLADNLYFQHALAIQSLRKYKTDPLGMPADDVIDVEHMLTNFKNALGEDAVEALHDIKPEQMISFYQNLMGSIQVSTYKMFNDFDKITKRTQGEIRKFQDLQRRLNIELEKDAPFKRQVMHTERQLVLKSKELRKMERASKHVRQTEKYRTLKKEVEELQKTKIKQEDRLHQFRKQTFTTAERKEYDRLRRKIDALVETQTEHEDFIRRMGLEGPQDDKHVQLLHALIYRQEYYPIYQVMERLHIADFLVGGEFQTAIRNMHEVLNIVNRVKTDFETGHIIEIPPKITNYMKKHHPELATRSLEEQLKRYLEFHRTEILDDIERLRRSKAINMDHLRTKKSKQINNMSAILMNATEKEDKNNYIFSQKFYMETDEHNLYDLAHDMRGEKYTGDLDFDNANFVFLDMETEGLGKDDKAFQVGIVKVMPDGTREVHNVYLDTGRDLPEYIKKLTGHEGDRYTKELARQGFRDNKQVQQFINSLVDDDSIIISHNASFEMKHFPEVFGEENLRNVPVLDTLPLFRLHVAEQENKIQKEITAILKEMDATTEVEWRQELERRLRKKRHLLERYQGIERQKQDYLAERLLSKDRREAIANDLRQKFGNPGIQDHNAVYDAAILEELLNNYTDPEKKAHRMLPKLMKDYNISQVKDLNNRNVGVVNEYGRRQMRMKYMEVVKKLRKYRRDMENITSKDEAVSESIHRVLDQLDDFRKKLDVEPTKIDLKRLHSNIDEMNRHISHIEQYIKEATDPQMLDSPLEPGILFSGDIQGMKEIINDVVDLENLLEEQFDNNDRILNAVFGDMRATVVKNKLFNNFRIMAEYNNNKDLRELVHIMRGEIDQLELGNDRNLAVVFKDMMEDQLKALDIDIKGKNHSEVLRLYRQNYDNDFTRFFDFIDEVDEYVEFNEKIYGDIHNRIKKATTDAQKETLRIGAARVNEFMDKLEARYKRMIDNARMEGRRITEEELQGEFFHLLGDKQYENILKSEELRKHMVDYVGVKTTTQIEDFVRRRIQKYIASGYKDMRLFVNIDSQTSHDFYHMMKTNLLDTMFEATKRIEDARTLEMPPYTRLKSKVETALADLRRPLRDIKYENLNSNSYHLGAINKHIENLKSKGILEDFHSTGELVSRNELDIIRLTKDSLEHTKASRETYNLLTGLTKDPEGLATYKSTKHKSDLNVVLDNVVKKVTGSDQATARVLSSYFEKNQKKTKERLIKMEMFDSFLSFHEDSDNVKAMYRAFKNVESWAMESGYLKPLKDGSPDPEAATELMHRLKASLWDFVQETEPLHYKHTLGELYGQGKTKFELFKSKTQHMKQMQEVFQGTQHSYTSLRDYFGPGRQGAEKMHRFIRDNPDEYALVRLDRSDKTDTGMMISKLDVKSVDDILTLDRIKEQTGASMESVGVVDLNTYYKLMRQTQQVFKFKRGGVADKIRRHYLMPLKSLMLASANFVFSNVFDAVLKNVLMQEGGLASSRFIMADMAKAAKMHKHYMDLFEHAKEIGMTYDMFKGKKTTWVDIYSDYLHRTGKMTPKLKQHITEAKFVHEFLDEPAASGQFQELLMSMKEGHIGKGKQSTKYEKLINTLFFGKGPLAWNMNLNTRVEIYSRLALHLNDLEKGLTKNESLARVLKTHYNYIDKSREEMYAEFVIPFMSFPIRSFLFWADAFHAHPDQTRLLSKLITRSWGQQEIADDEYVQYQAVRGRLPVGDYAVNLGLTWPDAMTAMAGREDVPIPFADQAIRKINPVAKNLFDREREMPERISRIPGPSHIAAMNRSYTALREGDTSLHRHFGSMFDPYYRGSANFSHRVSTYRHPNFRTPYSYNTGNLVPRASRSIRWRMTNLDRFKAPRT